MTAPSGRIVTNAPWLAFIAGPWSASTRAKVCSACFWSAGSSVVCTTRSWSA
jgi:hypothetical protein